MDDNEIKQIRKIIFPQMKIVEERLENTSFFLERDENIDAIPILFKAVDITLRILLAFKQKRLGNFQKNIKSVEEEYKKEGLCDEESIALFLSLYKMKEKYKNEIELEYEYSAIKSIFKKTENFFDKTWKFLNTQLTTSKERTIQRWTKKIFISVGILIGLLITILLPVKFGEKLFGPKHGLLAHYYNNINLEEPFAAERVDKKIDFNWGPSPSSPHSKINEEFSIRWQGRIKINKNDHYTFYIESDEGVRLFLDDIIIIDTWSNLNRIGENSVDIYLKKGFHKIRLEYYFNKYHADIKLLWNSNSFKKRILGNEIFYLPPRINDSR